jgi:hypothetical protein
MSAEHVGIPPQCDYVYRNDPYSASGKRIMVSRSQTYDAQYETVVVESPPLPPPYETSPTLPMILHGALASQGLTFSPFPKAAGAMQPKTPEELAPLSKIFVGQVPFEISFEQMRHAIAAVSGVSIYHMEIIVDWKNSKKPKGCARVYCEEHQVEAILQANERILFDEGGVWPIRCPEDSATVNAHLSTLVGQLCTSTGACLPKGLTTFARAKSTYESNPKYFVKGFVQHRPVC